MSDIGECRLIFTDEYFWGEIHRFIDGVFFFLALKSTITDITSYLFGFIIEKGSGAQVRAKKRHKRHFKENANFASNPISLHYPTKPMVWPSICSVS